MSSSNNTNLVKRHITNSKTTEEVLNPIVKDSKCKLINSKCSESYYCHTYDPSNYVKILCEDPFNLNSDVISRFDCCKKEKCCNVVSISLYLKEDCNINIDTINNKYLIKTLPNIYATILNVKLNLPKWIVRLYLDKSVYNCIENLCKITKDKNKCDEICKIKEIYENILKSDNVEIYTYLCEDINISKTRTYRFLSMIDPDVNLYVIREADGIVSNLDCHNISVYENDDNLLFYLAYIMESMKRFNKVQTKDELRTFQYQSYSAWLNIYKYFFEKDFYKQSNNIYDLLAGTFSFKLKINNNYYYNKINEINKKIDNLNNMNDDEMLEYINKKGVITYPRNQEMMSILVDDQMYKSSSPECKFMDGMKFFIKEKKLLNTGFDEIFLLDIFKEIISINNIDFNERNRQGFIDKEKYDSISKFFLCDNINTIISFSCKGEILNNSCSINVDENKLNEVIDISKFDIDKISKNIEEQIYIIDLMFQKKNIKNEYKDKPIRVQCPYINKVRSINEFNKCEELLYLINTPFILGTTDKIMNHYLGETIKSINSLTNKNQGGRRIKNKRKSTNKLKKNKKKLTRKSKKNQIKKSKRLN